jgi:predicted secreted protein
MGITSGIVLFMVIWSMVFFIVLPLRMVSQGDTGQIVPGTHASAPADAQVGRKARITTMWAVPIWCLIAGVILSGAISVRDIDWFNRMATPDLAAD